MNGFKSLAKEDLIKQSLKELYTSFGYGQYRMGKFEPYDMYRENINFLKSDTVITFTDKTGKLMALKPDVTMSIVKSIRPDDVSKKLFYIENVFRMTSGSGEYREISQIGLESVGECDCFRQAEVIALAAKTLETIDSEWLICLSHMGFISAVFDICGFDRDTAAKAAEALSSRNKAQLLSLAGKNTVTDKTLKLLETLVSLSSPVGEAVETLRSLSAGEKMNAAVNEIEALFGALSRAADPDRIKLDFTLVNDLDYYTGVVFRGFIKNLPRAVLSGGRYDNLMRKFNKPQSAVGFALYLGEIPRLFSEDESCDADILLIYDDASAPLVMSVADDLVKTGKSVRTEKNRPNGISARQTYRLLPDGTTEVEPLDQHSAS
ncbi:MAG: ATP phosphoribosyltransferase regulatory subunit [Oscillospiraceae bacterium]|nr:ATP phosphoribosyltransferase regulatory subunit [Oscillospiraceae bacterium]